MNAPFSPDRAAEVSGQAPQAPVDAAPQRKPPFAVSAEIIARFEQAFRVNPDNQCWEWQLGRSPKGYGIFIVNRLSYRAHRAAYLIYKGVDPAHQLVCHECDNPACVNPEHLWLGTVADNAKDAADKGRLPTIFRAGAPNPMSTLSNAQATALRDRYNSGEPSRLLAAEYGVHRTTVVRIAAGTTRARAS